MAENGTKEQMSDLEIKVCEQIEYYFGDHNLPRDKFLKEQIKLDDDGWVPFDTMVKFNRLSRLTTDFELIADALRKSKTGLLEVSEDKTKVRRSPEKPLPEVTEYKNSVKNRSVYVKGFPTEATFDEIKTWLEDKGHMENIQMRRTLQKAFKGSIFAVFDTDESAKKFLNTPGQKYKDCDLIILTKDDYFSKKQEERKQHRADSKSKSKQAKEDSQKKAEEDEMKALDEKLGCLLKFSGDLDDQTSREDIHTVFAECGDIKWIDFNRGAKEGIILFKEKASEALDKAKVKAVNDGKLQLREIDVKWEVLVGDVEKEALKKIVEAQQEALNKFRNKGGRKFKGKPRGGGGGGGGGRGGGRGGQSAQNKRKVQFQGKKTKFDSDDENDEDSKGAITPKKEEMDTSATKDEPSSPKKRPLEESDTSGEPASKQPKQEVEA